MKLAIVSPQHSEYTLQYANAMANRCNVLLIIDGAQLSREYEGRDVPLNPALTIHKANFGSPVDLMRAAVTLVRFRPAVVHFQEAAGFRKSIFNTSLAVMMSFLAKVVLTIHDPFPHQGRDAAVAWRSSWFGNVTRRIADIVVTHGTYCADRYREISRPGRQRIVTSTHGVILPPSREVEPSGSPLRLLFFGRMEQYKGVEVLLSAIEILDRQGVNFRALIAGKGPELDRLQARFEAFPQVTVWNTYVTSSDIIEQVQISDCILLPYLNATQSGVLATAFAGGRFVIASEVGGLGDVVSHLDNGLLVAPGSAEALADAVRLVAGDAALRERLREGARRSAQDGLSWARITGELHGVFLEAAE